MFSTPLAVAEMVKYACNAYHALKICFANEIGSFCALAGVDAARVMDIFAADKKLNISPAYLKPGFAFGGSCLPKDLRSLNYRAKEMDLRLPLLENLMPSNAEHLERAVQAVLLTEKRKVAILGLSFKAGTDDLRESPSVQLIKRLIGEGCTVRIWDDNVCLGRLLGSNRQFIEEVIPHIGSLLHNDLEEVIGSAEVVVIGTTAAGPAAMARHLRPGQIVIDLVNMKNGELAIEAPEPGVQVAAAD
jgi:GDP-mannose 6-dehydrogenase